MDQLLFQSKQVTQPKLKYDSLSEHFITFKSWNELIVFPQLH